MFEAQNFDEAFGGSQATALSMRAVAAAYVTSPRIPDAVEAMIALGRHTEAEPLIAALEDNGRRLDRAWMLAVGARCRSMALASFGDVEGANQMVKQALVE